MMNVKRHRTVTWLALGLLSLVIATIRVFPLLAEGPETGIEAKTKQPEGERGLNPRNEESKAQTGSEGEAAKKRSKRRAEGVRSSAGRGAETDDEDDRPSFGGAIGGAGIERARIPAMLGGGGFAAPGAARMLGSGIGAPNDSRYVSSGKIAISWSKAGDMLWGYSSLKGHWSKVKITPPKSGITPTVGMFVAAVPTDEHVYAFSNQTGRWSALKATGVPAVSQSEVLVQVGDEYHIFSDASGRWASQSEAKMETVDDPETKSSDPPVSVRLPMGEFGSVFAGEAAFLPKTNPGGQLSSRLLPLSAIPSKHFVEGTDLIVAWSATNDTLWGYSDSLRKWTRLRIPPPKRAMQPLFGGKVAVVSVDEKQHYAYSATTGTWDRLESTGAPYFLQDKVFVQENGNPDVNGYVHLFAASDGRWTSTKDLLESAARDEKTLLDSKGEPITPGGGGRRRGRGLPTARITSGFASAGAGGIPVAAAPAPIVDASGQPITLQDSDGDGELEVVHLDDEGNPIHFYAPLTPLSGASNTVPAKQALVSLKESVAKAEREAEQAAAEYRAARLRMKEEDPQCTALKLELERLVPQAFVQRQNAQRLEAEILRHRLKQVDDRLAERERLKDQITERRIQSLLDPALNWEPSEDVEK